VRQIRKRAMPLKLVTPLSVLVHMNVDNLKDTDIDRDCDLRIAPDGTLLVSFPVPVPLMRAMVASMHKLAVATTRSTCAVEPNPHALAALYSTHSACTRSSPGRGRARCRSRRQFLPLDLA
jgi:hypothetical protein